MRAPETLASLATQHHPAHLLVLRADVTAPDEVRDALRAALAAFGRVDVVFSGAVVATAGEVEGVPEESARAAFEVNFWGAARVAMEAVRVFRENRPRGGRLIVNCGAAETAGRAVNGWCCASKHGE